MGRAGARVARAARDLWIDLWDAWSGASCPGCGAVPPRRHAVCAACDAAVGRTGVAACLRCMAGAGEGAASAPTRLAGVCPRHGADRLLLAGPRYEAPLDRIVHAYKYEGGRSLHRWIAALLPEPPGFESLRRESVIVPVPLHRERLAWRGFDQARLLATSVGRSRGIPVADALERVRDHPPQARLGRDGRLANVRGAFRVRPEAVPLLAGRPVLLIDDVATTGSTLLEAAAALDTAAPSWILSLAAAHGGLPDGPEIPLHVEVATPPAL
ncbi:MAG TPA: ComF family protein [Candidatus Eisenbacteria bacterium]